MNGFSNGRNGSAPSQGYNNFSYHQRRKPSKEHAQELRVATIAALSHQMKGRISPSIWQAISRNLFCLENICLHHRKQRFPEVKETICLKIAWDCLRFERVHSLRMIVFLGLFLTPSPLWMQNDVIVTHEFDVFLFFVLLTSFYAIASKNSLLARQ